MRGLCATIPLPTVSSLGFEGRWDSKAGRTEISGKSALVLTSATVLPNAFVFMTSSSNVSSPSSAPSLCFALMSRTIPGAMSRSTAIFSILSTTTHRVSSVVIKHSIHLLVSFPGTACSTSISTTTAAWSIINVSYFSILRVATTPLSLPGMSTTFHGEGLK